MNKKSRIIIFLMLVSMELGACGTTELEERCFPQLVTVGYDDRQVTFCAGFPRVGGAGEEKPQINEIQVPIVSASNFADSRAKYEKHLNKLADYNHLKVFVFEEELLEATTIYEEVLSNLAKQEDFPRNTYVCAVDDIEELLEIEKTLPQDLGTYLEEYLTNHEAKKGRLLTLGDLLDEVQNAKMVLYMPFLEVEESYVEWGGYYELADKTMRFFE